MVNTCICLLLLGHACWAYVTGRLLAYPLGIRPNLYLLIMLGMLPDVDLLLGIFGIQHRTFTHSVLFWSVVFIPVFAKYRLVAIPYFVAVTQHLLLGDLVVGKTSILWPVIDLRVGLALPLLSPISLALEGAGLALFSLMAMRNKELASPKSIIMPILAVIPLAGFVVLSSFGEALLPFLLEGSEARHLEKSLPGILANPTVMIAVALHIALICLILVPAIRSTLAKRIPAMQP